MADTLDSTIAYYTKQLEKVKKLKYWISRLEDSGVEVFGYSTVEGSVYLNPFSYWISRDLFEGTFWLANTLDDSDPLEFQSWEALVSYVKESHERFNRQGF